MFNLVSVTALETRAKLKNNILFFMLVFMFNSFPLLAQQGHYFTSNGKRVNVKKFDDDITKMLRELDIPAASIGVIENNEVVYAHSYGIKSVTLSQKVNSNTVFEAASLSKMLLLFVVQEMVDKRQIDLTKPMYEYLEYEPLKHDSRYKLITPKMILSHTSGIENWKSFNNPDTLEIVADPGKKFVYSGEGYQYLAKVVEKILNNTYDNYIYQRIVNKLNLKNTYLHYIKDNKERLEVPNNYVVGHKDFGAPVPKWKNIISIPASGVSTNCQDYARFIVAMFNSKYVTDATVSSMLRPVIPYKQGDSVVWVGQGFFTICTKKDTIAFFNGVNDGFRSGVFYSKVQKRGFVFFTNSDRGELITGHLATLTTGFNLKPLFSTSFSSVYPSQAISLMHLYQKEGQDAMIRQIEQFKNLKALHENTLNELGDSFMSQNTQLCRRLLNLNINLFPNSSLAYCLLGGSFYQSKDYRQAYINLNKAKELGFTMWDIEGPLQESFNHIK